MPAPAAVYALAIVGSIAAGLAFKEFVYEPHIAPRIERWAEEFLAKRKARRMQRAGLSAVPVSSAGGLRSTSEPPNEGGNDGATYGGQSVDKSTFELETLVANEVRQWRSQVDVNRGEGSGLRYRKNVGSSTTTGSTLDESNILIPYSLLTPTHVLFDPAEALSASSPTSTISSRVGTPSPHSTLSHSTFRTPPPLVAQAPPTPEPSARGSPAPSSLARGPESDPLIFAAASPHHVPSLSLSYPLNLDAEHDLELLSAPSSSRPVSPFSAFSQPTGTGEDEFHSFTLSPQLGMRSASESGPRLATTTSSGGATLGARSPAPAGRARTSLFRVSVCIHDALPLPVFITAYLHVPDL
ncbi:hypothetical protein B0H10DRAFT_1878336 [Mycena sp. CBHHK59/15]|nr:hypothetical protein B0H10DRAFT_1878336 [Mycena sp. CBHHK59/15]